MKLILFLIAISFCACGTTEKTMYVQPMVKTMTGYQRIGKPYPHVVLLGDTIKVIYSKF